VFILCHVCMNHCVSYLSEPYNVMSEPFVFIVIQSYMYAVIVFDDSTCFCDTTLYVYCDTILYVCFLCLFQHASDDSGEENQVL
jgi:membrane-bound acyltransferase YfiQ involved in biofilm formation